MNPVLKQFENKLNEIGSSICKVQAKTLIDFRKISQSARTLNGSGLKAFYLLPGGSRVEI